MFKELRFKKLICALVAMAVVLSPWGSDVLPEPLDRLGAEPALAQQPPTAAVIDGTPAPCPQSVPGGPQWAFYGDPPDPRSPLCWVESYLPCPRSPLSAGGQMSMVADRTDLCEAVATVGDDADIVNDCLRVNADGHLVDDNGDPVPKLDGNGDPELDADGNRIPVDFSSSTNPMPAGVDDFVNRYEIAGGAPTCRLLAPSGCPTDEGLYRVSRTACRGYVRRTWTCPTTHPIALNRSNRCYGRSAIDMSSGHPACNQNPPVAVVDCENYVGADFVANPDAAACDEFDRRYNEAHPATEPPLDTFEPAANAHWCSYEVMHLHPKCDRSNASDPDCDPQSTAVCIMRSSGIGGCDGVAHRMICSDLQAAFANASGQSTPDRNAIDRTLERLRENDCRPCVSLPFSDASACDPHGLTPTPVPSALGVPTVGDVRVDSVEFQLFAWDFDNRATTQGKRYYQVDESAIFARFARMSYTDHGACSPWARQMLTDMNNGLRPDYSNFASHDPADPAYQSRFLHDECKQILCSSPTVGRVDWTSEHVSGLAIIGTPTIMTIDDIPLKTQTIRYIDRKIPGGTSLGTDGTGAYPSLHRGERRFLLRYDPVAGNEPLLFTREESANDGPSHSIGEFYSNRVECSLRDPARHVSNGTDLLSGTDDDVSWYDDGDIPEFSLLITELWPDTDAAEIKELFGEDALEWWDQMEDPDESRAFKSRASEARGYVYIDEDVLSEAEITEERSRRTWERTEEIPCAFPVPGSRNSSALRCRWTPKRAGYYSVQAAGVWRLHVHDVDEKPLRLLEPDERASLNRLLAYDGSAEDQDGTGPDDVCSHSGGLQRNRDRDCLIEDLEWIIDFDPDDRTPRPTPEEIELIRSTVIAELTGLNSDFTGLLGANENTLPDPWARNCLTVRDFRYTCHPYKPNGAGLMNAATNHGPDGASYTTSEPVGVMVHGAQIVSRRPAGSP